MSVRDAQDELKADLWQSPLGESKQWATFLVVADKEVAHTQVE